MAFSTDNCIAWEGKTVISSYRMTVQQPIFAALQRVDVGVPHVPDTLAYLLKHLAQPFAA
jgi:hypothetical protein